MLERRFVPLKRGPWVFRMGFISESLMKLVLLSGPGKGAVFDLEEGTNLIGRWDPEEGACPEIDLEEFDVDAKVSRKHAIVHVEGERVSVEDMGSLNGTYLDRVGRLEHGRVVELVPGAEIVVGTLKLRLDD